MPKEKTLKCDRCGEDTPISRIDMYFIGYLANVSHPNKAADEFKAFICFDCAYLMNFAAANAEDFDEEVRSPYLNKE